MLASSSIKHCIFFHVFSVEYSAICRPTIYQSTNYVLVYYGEICIFAPIYCIVCVRMVISFYPATRIHVHFSHEVRSLCAHCASFRRWPGPVVWAFLTVAYRWSRWNRSSCPLFIFTFEWLQFYVNLNLLGTRVSSLHQWHHLRYRFKAFSIYQRK